MVRERLIPCCGDGEELTNECVGADTFQMSGLRGQIQIPLPATDGDVH
jgi:hypothetical protein